MQVEDTRVYRVKELAEMYAVSPSTIYRAVKSGELDAYKLGTGRSAVLRIPARAIGVWLEGCGVAAYEAYVEGGADPATDDCDPGEGLTEAQADGLACVVCGLDYRVKEGIGVEHRPVGHSPGGSQLFACSSHRAVHRAAEQLGEVSR